MYVLIKTFEFSATLHYLFKKLTFLIAEQIDSKGLKICFVIACFHFYRWRFGFAFAFL